MGKEINLLASYPKSTRDTASRANQKTETDRKIARRFDEEFFDGDRKHGYGGFNYNERFWSPVIPKFTEYWNLTKDSSVLKSSMFCFKIGSIRFCVDVICLLFGKVIKDFTRYPPC
mgnify:CR=1 FL=1